MTNPKAKLSKALESALHETDEMIRQLGEVRDRITKVRRIVVSELIEEEVASR